MTEFEPEFETEFETAVGDAGANAVASILADGFAEDPVMRWIFDPSDLPHALEPFFSFLMREVYVPAGATSHLADTAAAAWLPPEPEPWPDDRTLAMAELLSSFAPGTTERVITLDEATRANHPTDPHWYLGLLATRCRSQGSGLGSALLKEGLTRTDAAALPSYLESSNPRNVPFYARHGFTPIGRIDLPDGPPLIPMWREPERRA